MTSSQYPSRISMPCPFASDNGAALTPIGTSAGNTVNFHDGFPSVYAAPASGGGKYVTRGEMNAIGNLASNDLFYHKAGGLNTFDQEFCGVIGGYPAGAVLQMVNVDEGKIFNVISLHDDNDTNFNVVGVDNINWRYLNLDNAIPSGATTIGTIAIGYNGGANTAIVGLGFLKATKTGILGMIDPGGDEDAFSATSTTGAYLGYGIMFKDVGTTIPASMNWPSSSSANDFSLLAGLRSGWATTSVSTSAWDKSATSASIQSGHYIAFAQFIGKVLTGDAAYSVINPDLRDITITLS